MGKRQSAREQRNGFCFIIHAVFSVSHQRPATAGKLHPALVRSAGAQANAYKAHFFVSTQYPIAQLRGLHILAGLVSHQGHAACLIPVQQIMQRAFRWRMAVNHRKILFFEAAFPELGRKVRSRPGCPGQYHKTADCLIQTVNGSYHRAGISQFLSDTLRQAAGLVGGKHACRLDADHHPVIGVNDFQQSFSQRQFQF